MLWWYLLISFLTDITILHFRQHRLPHLAAASFFLLFEFVIVSIYYYPRVFNKREFWLFFMITLAASISYFITWKLKGFNEFNGSAGGIIFSPILCTYGLIGLRRILTEQRDLFLERSAFFWANVAFVPYFAGCFFILLFSDYYFNQDQKALLAALWIFHDVFNIGKNCCLAFSLKQKAPDGQNTY